MKMKKNDAKHDLLIIDAETGLLSHPSTLECVSPNTGIFFPNLFGDSSERIILYHADSPPFCNLYHLFTLSLLSSQTRHGRNIISFYFFLLISGRA